MSASLLKNRKVLKSRTSTAVPAVAPFIPSSTPGSDLHWRKAATRKAKGEKLARSASADRSTNQRVKNRTTEYDEKFVEWEIPERDEARAADRQYAPTGFYERDVNAFDWKSEQQRNYMKKDLSSGDVRTAGVPRGSRSDAPTTWYVEDDGLNNYNEELSGSGKAGGARSASAGRRQASEHTSKFSWPASAERAHSTKPLNSVKSSPLAYDTSALLGGAEQWNSEYDAQCAELRRKQREVGMGPQTIAGMANVAHGSIPAFYAWEEDESRPRVQKPQPASMGAHRGTSEYKMKFVEHPHQERQKPIVPDIPEQLNLFHEDHPEAHSLERSSSVLHRDYPGHDVTALGLSRGASPGRGRDDANPKSFAWPLVDGGAYSDDDESPSTLMRKNRVKNLVMANSNCSEYTRKFANPPHEAYTNRARPEKPKAGKALDLFAEDAASGHLKQTSEYNAEFHVHPDAQSPGRVTAASQTLAHDHNYPAQFAWSLVNGGESTLENPTRSKRAALPTQDMSEYSRKFAWPAPTERSPPRHGNAATAGASGLAESIMGLDVGSMGGAQWQSEYDLQCAQLRKKQEELRASGTSSHIAGVATKVREPIPTNYAWEMPPPPPAPDAGHEQRADHPPVVHSEHSDSFVQWPVGRREKIKPRLEADTLNLFREEPSSETKNSVGEEGEGNAPAAPSARSHMQSEYTQQFHAFDGTTTRPPIASGLRGVPLPPQFAWPRVDPPVPPSEHVKSADEVPFTETSEYDARFSWPVMTQPATLIRPGTNNTGAVRMNLNLNNLNSPVILPIPDKNATDQNWVSEYGAHAADAVHGSELLRDAPAAGMVTVVQKNIPHFYAWRETDAPVQAAPKVELPRYHGDQVRSEYDDAFVAPPVTARVEPVTHTKPVAPALNILSDRSNLSGPAVAPKSEYLSQFVPHTVEEVRNLVNPYASSKSSAVEVPKPPQFAWPLVDGQPNQEGNRHVDSARAPHSEYATQFVWHGLSDNANGRRAVRSSVLSGDVVKDEADAAQALAATVRAVTANAPIAFDEDAMRTSDWQSEYDSRCATLRAKQLEISKHTVPDAIAGIHTVPAENPPAFYAYESKEEKKAPVHLAAHVEPELTEYSANYTSWPVKAEAACGSNRRGSELQYKETFKAFQFGKDRSFHGVTEYDDQYSPKSVASPHAAAHQLTASMNAKYSAPNPIVPAPAPVASVAAARPKTAPARGKGSKVTENTSSYQWPDKSRLSGTAIPVRNSQSSSVVIGTNHPAFRNKKNSAGKPLFIPARSVRPSTAPAPAACSGADSGDDAFPESAFQSSSETKESAEDKSRAKYRLMSQEIRDRRAGNATRSDYTTGVLSATTKSADATLNRNAPGAQQFHISNQFGVNHTPLQHTGTMSADSLAGGASSMRLGSSCRDTGLRFPDQSSHQTYRARSVPHRQRLAVSHNYDHRSPVKARAVDDADSSNPVLLNKRYPYVSKKQLGRWSTETGNSFRWRKKGSGLNTSAVSLASH